MKFTEIDTQTWPRGQMFYYFSKVAPTGFSMTVELDITHMRNILKEKKLKFFPAYLWVVTKSLNQQIEFKTAMKEEKPGYYDVLTPLYATFHEDDNTISFMWTEFGENFLEFYENYMENQLKYGEHHGVLAQNDRMPPENSYTISVIPWVKFEHFAIHSYQDKPYYFPSVEAGKFYEKDGKMMLPLSITCHHATTDGYHVNKWLETLQYAIDHFEEEMQNG